MLELVFDRHCSGVAVEPIGIKKYSCEIAWHCNQQTANTPITAVVNELRSARFHAPNIQQIPTVIFQTVTNYD